MRREIRKHKQSLRSAPRLRCALHTLEPRLLLSAIDPSASEQQSLFLLNRMRTSPAAELSLILNSGDPQLATALTYFNVDLALLQQQWNALTPVAPLAWNSLLGAAALAHNDLMLQLSTQAHQLPGESKLGQRILDAGYDYAWVGENIYAYAYSPFYAHAGFAIDWGDAATDIGGIQTPPGHRNNIMSSQFREVGIATKVDLDGTNTVGPLLVTQDFGRVLATQNAWVVGTIYNDADADDYYDLTEGVANVTVTAKNIATGNEYSTTARTAGGYQLQLPAGEYTLTYSGGTLPASQQVSLTVGSANILQDLDTSQIVAPPPPPVNDPPIGAFDVPTSFLFENTDLGPRTLTGYAFDAQAGESPLQVRILLDGISLGDFTANLPRTDLSVGSPNHGFSVDLPWLSAGTHTVTLLALDNPSNDATSVATTSITVDATPVGYVDVLNNATLAGWAFDPAATTATQIRIDMDGTPLLTISADRSRSDLLPLFGSSDHGFFTTLPTVPAGTHLFQIYALDDTSASATLLGSASLTFNTPPIGYLDVASETKIAGWAQDPDSPDQPVTVRIDINGQTIQTLAASAFRADLTSVGTGNYSFSIDTTALDPGEYTVDLYALDSTTSEPSLLGTQTLTINAAAVPDNPPVGYLDFLSGANLVGWAADFDSPSTPISIRVDLDGVTVFTGPTNVERPDLLSILPDAHHGFSIFIPQLAAGAHTVEIYALNAADNAPTLLAARTTSSAVPIGYVDRATSSQLVGWALHPDLGTSPVTLELTIDGLPVLTAQAANYRADLDALFGSGNHGFSIDLPTLAAGTHQITLKIQNPFNAIAVSILDISMTFE